MVPCATISLFIYVPRFLLTQFFLCEPVFFYGRFYDLLSFFSNVDKKFFADPDDA